MATAVVEFASKTGTKLCSISADEFAKKLGVKKIYIDELLPDFSPVKDNNLIGMRNNTGTIKNQKKSKRRR